MANTYIDYTGDGSTVDFVFPFAYQNAADVTVTLDGVSSDDFELISEYTVRFDVAPAAAVAIRIARSTDAAAPVTWADGANILGRHLNKSSTHSRYLAEEAREIALEASEDANATLAAVTAAVTAAEAAESTAVAAAAAAVPAAATATTKAAEADASADAAVTSETNAAASATAAASSASTATSQATSATASAATATTKAGLAATSETNAAASAAAAASSQSAAATSATAAAASATSAAASVVAAASSFDGFDDRYLGEKAADPTLDNDGNALITGALYFNNVLSKMKVYSGVGWQLAFNDTVAASAITNDSSVTGSTVAGALDTLKAADLAKIPTADIVDNLTTNDATKPLSAKQGKTLKDTADTLATTVSGKVATSSIVDNLTSGGSAVPLSAEQGKTLKTTADALATTVSGKAASSHTHAAADITSGVLDVARLGTGTPSSSKVLQGDGTWADKLVAGATLIASGSLSGSSLVLTNIPQTYSYIILVLSGVSPNGDGTSSGVRFSHNNGVSYDSASNYKYQDGDGDGTGSAHPTRVNTTTNIPFVSMAAAHSYSAQVKLQGYQAGTRTMFDSWCIHSSGIYNHYHGIHDSTSIVDALQFALSVNAFDAGTYALYGYH